MFQIPLLGSQFSLDSSGVAGILGGDEAVSAMGTVHVYEGRRWLGWYNSPGSYEIAKRYGQLANSRLWSGLYPGDDRDPATLFELDGKAGPKFIATQSGTIMEKTGHISHLFSQECKAMKADKVPMRRTSSAIPVTIVDLHREPREKIYPRRIESNSALLSSFPICASIATCVICGLYRDWFSFALILLGMLSNGISCFVIGSGKLAFTRPRSAPCVPPGDGMLVNDHAVIILRGSEGAVTAVTRGKFKLDFGDAEPEFRNIGLSSLMLMTQFILQLLLIPQAHLFGQIMFLSSLAVSAFYHAYLSSLNKEEIQKQILRKQVLQLDPQSIRKYEMGTRTAMAVFTLLVLKPWDPAMHLCHLIPNDTPVWRQWRQVIVQKFKLQQPLTFIEADWAAEGLSEPDRALLKTLLYDAQSAYGGYLRWRATNPPDSVCSFGGDEKV